VLLFEVQSQERDIDSPLVRQIAQVVDARDGTKRVLHVHRFLVAFLLPLLFFVVFRSTIAMKSKMPSL
jgi:hypothetical protein